MRPLNARAHICNHTPTRQTAERRIAVQTTPTDTDCVVNFVPYYTLPAGTSNPSAAGPALICNGRNQSDPCIFPVGATATTNTVKVTYQIQ